MLSEKAAAAQASVERTKLLSTTPRWSPPREQDSTARGLPADREAWNEWLTKVFGASTNPLWFGTWTFAPRPYEIAWGKRPSSTRVERAGSWLSWFMTRTLGSPSYFTVMEFGSLSGRRHLHSLISSPEPNIRAAQLWHESGQGFSKLLPAASIGGVSGYVTKYVLKSADPVWFAGGPLWRTS